MSRFESEPYELVNINAIIRGRGEGDEDEWDLEKYGDEQLEKMIRERREWLSELVGNEVFWESDMLFIYTGIEDYCEFELADYQCFSDLKNRNIEALYHDIMMLRQTIDCM